MCDVLGKRVLCEGGECVICEGGECACYTDVWKGGECVRVLYRCVEGRRVRAHAIQMCGREESACACYTDVGGRFVSVTSVRTGCNGLANSAHFRLQPTSIPHTARVICIVTQQAV